MDRIRSSVIWGSLAVTLCILSGCGTGLDQSSSTGLLNQAIAGATANYAVVDLDTGAVELARSVPDLSDNPRYRTSAMVFRAVEDGDAVLGSAPGSFGAQADEPRRTTRVVRFYLAVFETTQAQWERIAGSRPWTGLPATCAAIGDGYPAVGISQVAAETAFAAWNRTHPQVGLSLPDDAQWEHACRAGGTGLWSWGEASAAEMVRGQARVAETAAAESGAAVVGQRQANAFGFHDMHGNVWEWTTSGTIRGGSWSEPLAQARAANRVELEGEAAHALVGIRILAVIR